MASLGLVSALVSPEAEHKNIVIIGAGINGLVAAHYLQRAGYQIDLVERKQRVGGACVAATANVTGVDQDYALGASVQRAWAGHENRNKPWFFIGSNHEPLRRFPQRNG